MSFKEWNSSLMRGMAVAIIVRSKAIRNTASIRAITTMVACFASGYAASASSGPSGCDGFVADVLLKSSGCGEETLDAFSWTDCGLVTALSMLPMVGFCSFTVMEVFTILTPGVGIV